MTRDEIRETVWGDRIVDHDQGINNSVREIRAVLGDDDAAERLIQTVPKRGYRLSIPRDAPAPTQNRRLNRVTVATTFAIAFLVIGLYTWHLHADAQRTSRTSQSANEAYLAGLHHLDPGGAEGVERAIVLLQVGRARSDVRAGLCQTRRRLSSRANF